VRASRSLSPALGALLLLAIAAPASAQWAPSYSAIKGMDETVRINVGGFFQKFDSTVQFYGPDGTPGNVWNIGDFLGENANQTTVRIDGYWRFGRHANLQFGYRGWSKSNDHILSQDIEIDGVLYPVNAQVSAKAGQYIAELYYAYSFVNDGELEFGTMLGISAYYNKYSISGEASVGGVGTGVQTTEDNFLAPLPAVGAYFNFTLLPQFFVYGKVKWLPKITVSGRSGTMIDVTAGLDIFITKNIGIGGGYEYTKIDYEHAVPGGVDISLKYSGPLAYLALAF
jgi:opacity protein-like surface antigen